jgi:hypothetical protein
MRCCYGDDPPPLFQLYKDLIMILLHGATSDVANLAALEKCEIGVLLGDEIAISLGQIAQTYVLETLQGFLTQDYQLEGI